MKTLLAIINEPKESKNFIHYVALMATDLKASVHLLYVPYPYNYALSVAGSAGTAAMQAQKNTEAIADNANMILAEHIKDVKSKISTNIDISYSSELGVTSIIAKKMVSDNKVNMLVLEGQENESFLTQTSSNMEIIGSVDCPVWIVPDNMEYHPFTEILFATDYKEEDITGLKRLITLTRPFSPNITVLHITDSIDFEEKVKKAGFLEMLQKSTAYDRLSVNAISVSSNDETVELFNNYALLVNADLIVVQKENKSFLGRIFKSDPAKKIIKKSILPVLVFHEKE